MTTYRPGLAGLFLCFIACFILLVIAPSAPNTRRPSISCMYIATVARCCHGTQGYRIYQGGLTLATTAWRPVTVGARETRTTISDLRPDNTYQFQISAFTAVGDGPLSDPVQVVLRSAGSHWLSLKFSFSLDSETDPQRYEHCCCCCCCCRELLLLLSDFQCIKTFLFINRS